MIYNGRAYNGNGVSPQGIITAYYVTPVTTAAVPNATAGTVSASYRTNCPVYQNI